MRFSFWVSNQFESLPKHIMVRGITKIMIFMELHQFESLPKYIMVRGITKITIFMKLFYINKVI